MRQPYIVSLELFDPDGLSIKHTYVPLHFLTQTMAAEYFYYALAKAGRELFKDTQHHDATRTQRTTAPPHRA